LWIQSLDSHQIKVVYEEDIPVCHAPVSRLR
jgi:hypothetical protein